MLLILQIIYILNCLKIDNTNWKIIQTKEIDQTNKATTNSCGPVVSALYYGYLSARQTFQPKLYIHTTPHPYLALKLSDNEL